MRAPMRAMLQRDLGQYHCEYHGVPTMAQCRPTPNFAVGPSPARSLPLTRRITRRVALTPLIVATLAGLLLLPPSTLSAATSGRSVIESHLPAGSRADAATPSTRLTKPATKRLASRMTKWCTAPSGQKFLSCSPTTTAPSGVTNHFNFRVRNPTVNDAGYKTSVSCSGMATISCSADLGVIFVMSDGGEADVPVSWQTPADSAGTLLLTVVLSPMGSGATDTLTATLHATMYVPPTYTVSVTPDGSDAYRTQPLSTSYSFRVENLGNTNATYKLTATCSDGATSCSAPSTKFVAPGADSMVTVSFNSGSAGSEGTVTLKATADSTGGSGTVGGIVTGDEGFINVRPFTRTVAVTPGGGAITKAAGSSDTATFTVSLTGNASSVTYNLVRSCTAPVQSCGAAPSTVTVTKSTPATVNISYSTASDLHGGVGGITLRAYSVYGSKTYESTGSYQVTVPNTADDIAITIASPTTAVERGACLTIAAGEAAAYECGSLRVVHSIPGVRTMGQGRAPTLLYASETAEPRPSVRADLLLKSSAATPSSLTGVLTVGNAGSQQTCNQSWTTSGWTPGTVRRVVATCTSTALTTGAYPYTLQVTAIISGTTKSFSKSGTLIVVNRSASPFGAGWSMAGLEQLFFPADANTRLWVAGDGSARLYRRVGTTNTYYADSLDGPDSLTYDPTSSTYTRWAAHRLQVKFNSAGLHTATTNRLAQTTTFSYTGGLLQSIAVPPSAAGLSFTFGYTSGKLSSISSPGTPTARVTTVSQSSGRVNSITDPDTSTVSFGYSGTGKLIVSRTDRMGHATSYAYNTTSGTLDSVSIAMESTTPAINTHFWPEEAVGLSGGAATDTSSVYTVMADPRFNFSTIWVDKFGAPRRVLNSVNGMTVIERGDTRWPLLATKLVAPGGLTSTATYDGHGNISEQKVLAPLGVTGQDAITTYAYDEQFDFPVRIQGPTGEVWRSVIDPATGNRLMESPTDTSGLHATSYLYDSICKMARTVSAPGTPPDSIFYDGRCNPVRFKSPMNYQSTVHTDSIGRVVATVAVDGRRDSTVYDIVGRVVRQIGKASSGSQQLVVTSKYDKSGRVTSVSRIPSPNPLNLDTLTNSFVYDWAGRKIWSIAPDSAIDSTQYDPNGNAIKLYTRLGGNSLPITMSYDAVNRLVKRSVPAYSYSSERIGLATLTGSQPWAMDYPLFPNVAGQSGYSVAAQVDTFAYDAAGNMKLANNGDALVSRTFYANGLAKSETQKLRTLDGTSADTTQHAYTISYEYDLAGRNTKITVPSQLAPRVQIDTLASVLMLSGITPVVRDEINYTYDTGVDGTGWLERVDGLLPGDVFRYQYSRRGEVDSLIALAPVPDLDTVSTIYDVRSYNDDGSLKHHSTIRTRNMVGSPAVTDTLRNESFTLDAAGRVLGANDGIHWGVSVFPTERAFQYSAMGQLTQSDIDAVSDSLNAGFAATEKSTYDALGNWITRYNSSQWDFQWVGPGGYVTTGSRTGKYDPESGRLWAESLDGARRDTLMYDAAGNLHAMITTSAGSPLQYNERVSYFSIDGRLVAADARYAAVPGTGIVGHSAFEEYRYDALGRRVLSRVRRTCDDEPGAGNGGDEAACDVSAIRRTVWSGSSELAEIQMPANDSTPADTVENDTLPVRRERGAVIAQQYYDSNRLFGRVLYVHGLGTDQPLAVTRVNYADASDSTNGATTYGVYAPFSIVPLWSGLGKVDRAVLGSSASPGSERLCASISSKRCAYLGITWGDFIYMLKGPDAESWQGTLLVDKADATGTYYRRNRTYDPNTARFTQEDPIGLAGGMNLYGFAAGDPVNYSDPFGLFPCPELCGAGAGGGSVAVLPFLAPELPSLAPALPLAASVAVVAIAVRPAFPGADKVNLGRGQGTWASEATGTTGSPDLPEGLTGENPRQGSGNRINTDSKRDPQELFDELTGGQSSTEPSGHQVGPNGVRLRPGTEKKGPRIDIPARPPRPHETIHFPPQSQ